MALVPTSLAANIASAYQAFCNVNADGSPTFSDDNSSANPPPPTNSFSTDFASSYNTYGTAGIVLGAVNIGGDTSALISVIGGINNSPSFVTDFAAALVTYWSTVALVNGPPAHGGVSVMSVTNNASTKQSAFESAILGSYTQSRSEPFYLNFVQNIESVVKSIEWTITEMMPNGSPSAFIENIS